MATRAKQEQVDYKVLLAELQALLRAMQSEELDVDEMLRQYARGQELITQLEQYLEYAETKVVQLQVPFKKVQ